MISLLANTRAVATMARLELAKLFATRRGLVSIVGFVLIWLLILAYAIHPAAQFMQSPEVAGSAGALFEWFGWTALSDWDVPEMALYWVVALYLLPFFSVVIAADQIASDKTRGTLRYLMLRASRWQVFFGRFIGQSIIQVLLAVATLLSVLLMVAWFSSEELTAALTHAPVIIVNLALVLMPYVALMSLVSVLARSARQATLFAVIGWVLLSLVIVLVQSQFASAQWLGWLLPGSQISALLKLHGWQTLTIAHVPLVHTAVLLALGWWTMKRVTL